MDAGNPSTESRAEARGEESIDDPEGMPPAIVPHVGGRAISYSVMRGPATAQEGEAHSINAVVTSVQQSDLPPATIECAPWGIGDSQSASAATKAYYENQKANRTMSGIASQAHGGKPIIMNQPLNFSATGLPAATDWWTRRSSFRTPCWATGFSGGTSISPRPPYAGTSTS